MKATTQNPASSDAQHHERVREILGQLIAFPTVAGNSTALAGCLDYAEELLDAAGLQVERFDSNGLPSLVASSRPGRSSKVILQAHLDVVPCDAPLFQMVRQNDRLIGRGTFDMKFAAACFLAMAETLTDQTAELDYAIMLTCDEEVGGANGVKYLLKTAGYSSDLCVLPDGADNWAIEETAKGVWFVAATAEGRSAHGSRPWEADSAADKLLSFLHETRRQFPHAHQAGSTVVVSQFQSGEVVNQVPSAARSTLDIRFMDQAAHERIANGLLAAAEEYGIALASLEYANPSHLDVSLPPVELWKHIVTQVTGAKQIKHMLSPGSSDARFFTAAGIPTIVTRPIGGCAHGPEEWIDEHDLYRFYDCLLQFTRQVALAETSPK